MDRNEFITRLARKFVVQHLHYNGFYRSFLTEEAAFTAYCMCDGFGRMSRDWHKAYGWDWSHVRDSQPETFVKVADYIAEQTWVYGSIASIADQAIADCTRCGITLEQYLAA